jgi:hypothetical protein
MFFKSVGPADITEKRRLDEVKRSLIPTPSKTRTTNVIFSLERYTKPMMRKQTGSGKEWMPRWMNVERRKERLQRPR